MERVLTFTCPACKFLIYFSLEEVQQKLRREKWEHVVEVARELHLKQGPYYDRWKAAGGDKGNPNRCKDCLAFGPSGAPPGTTYCGYKGVLVKPWYFGCKMFRKFVGK